MVKDVKIKYIRGRKYIAIDGELFINAGSKFTKDDHVKELSFKPMKSSEKQYKKDIEFLVSTLSKKVNIKDVLRQKLYDMDLESINRLIKEINKGGKVKRRYGCLALNVGKESIQLID